MLGRIAIIGALALAACTGSIGSAGSGPCEGDRPADGCGTTCVVDTDCDVQLHCEAGSCTAECTIGGPECGAGATCDRDGRCVSIDEVQGGACPQVDVGPAPRTPTVQLVIDRSGSMTLPFGGGVDRRTAMIRALTDRTTGVVTGLQDRISFGASLYSSPITATTCPSLVSVPRDLGNAGAIATLLQDNRPDGNTPTAEAIDAAVDSFATDPALPSEQPVIVLATDGEPDTCVDGTDEAGGRRASVAAAQAAMRAGIPLFILSVGSEIGAEHLQQMANAGVGLPPDSATRAAFYVANDQDELTRVLRDILDRVRTCDIDLDATLDVTTASQGEVTLGRKRLAFGTDWTLVDGDTMRLLGGACQTLLATSDPLTGRFPCDVIVD
jgi:hypothetical protein